MQIDTVFAALPVGDMDRSLDWYVRLLGRPCDERPMAEAAEWAIDRGGSIQLVLDAERAGRSMATLAVSDIEALVADVGARGIAATPTPPGNGSFRLAQIADPDGNVLTFAEDQRGASSTDGLQHLAFPNESADYRSARNALLAEERVLRRQIERVAAQRRALPPGGRVQADYRFVGPDGPVLLSDLVTNGNDTLAVYSFMFGPERELPCPGCVHFLDGLDGSAPHIEQQVSFVVVAKSPFPRLQSVANERGWTKLRLLSTDGNDYDRDYFGDSTALTPAMRAQQAFNEGEEWDMPILNVFRRESDGTVRHFWGSELLYVPPEPGQDPRHNDLLDPMWNLFDMTPDGRGDFHPKLAYD